MISEEQQKEYDEILTTLHKWEKDPVTIDDCIFTRRQVRVLVDIISGLISDVNFGGGF